MLNDMSLLSRYPVHFHMCGHMADSIVRSNAVHDSLQRGYVIHGTHNVTARDNVAVDTVGHAFMFEDGIEQNNTLQHNLAISSQPATVGQPDLFRMDLVAATMSLARGCWSLRSSEQLLLSSLQYHGLRVICKVQASLLSVPLGL